VRRGLIRGINSGGVRAGGKYEMKKNVPDSRTAIESN
jgi:hypothetical protein